MIKFLVLVPITLLAVAGLYMLDDCSSKSSPTAPDAGLIPWADSICYSRNIEPLLTAHCSICHPSQNGVDFSGYDNAKSHIDRIIFRTSAGTMPKSGPLLTAAQIDTLKAWKQNGEKQCN